MTARTTHRIVTVIAGGIAGVIAGLALVLPYSPSQASAVLGDNNQAPLASYPLDPTTNITWTPASYNSVADIQTAFNNARATENSQLGSHTPATLTLPAQAVWNAMSNGEKALWLINRERIDRGVKPMHGVESNVTAVAQAYAEYLLANNATGHFADGHDPIWRLNQNAVISACHDFLSVAENLAYLWQSSGQIPLPVERAVYNWIYKDASSAWGHRHLVLWYPYVENGDTTEAEGFMGIGRATGPHQTWQSGEIIVLNVFDPGACWLYPTPRAFMPMVALP